MASENPTETPGEKRLDELEKREDRWESFREWMTVALRVAENVACPCPPTIGVQLAWPHGMA